MKTIKEQIEVMQAFEDGRTILVLYTDTHNSKGEINKKTHSNPCFNWVNNDYIVKKLEFPAPPEGETWHNPLNLTPEVVEIDKGYRLLLKSEIGLKFSDHPLFNKCDKFYNHKWNCQNEGYESYYTYRTLEPLPKKKVLVKKYVNFKNYNGSALWVLGFNGYKTLVIGISKDGNTLSLGNGRNFYTIKELADQQAKWSDNPHSGDNNWKEFFTVVEE